MHPLRFGIKTSQQASSYQEILPCWQEADQLGFDTAWLFDHFVALTPPNGPPPPVDTPCDEGWTMLAALLAKTERLRGGLMVGGNTHRHPAMLANIAATADQISNGRLEFGLGTGWSIAEHDMYGWDLPAIGERVRWFNEACTVLKSLWTQPTTTFDGSHYHLREARLEPKPVQKPYPHFVIGASGDKLTLRATARHADEWNWVGGPIETYKQKVEAVEGHCRDLGREPATLQRSVQFGIPADKSEAADLPDRIHEFIRAGMDHVVFNLPRPFSPKDAAWACRELVPAVRDRAGR